VLKPDDALVAVGPEGTTPEKVADAEQLRYLLNRWTREELRFVFERRTGAGEAAAKTRTPEQTETIELTLPANRFVDFGFRLAMDPIASIQGGSPAERAGFRKGDRIIAVGEDDEFDPMRLPSLVAAAAAAGQEMTFEVERREAGETQPRTVTLTVTPDNVPIWTEPIRANEPLEVPGLGLAYHVLPHIEAVAPGSPAEKAGLKRGDTINALAFAPPKTTVPKGAAKGKSAMAIPPLEFNDEGPHWAHAFYLIQSQPRQALELTVNHGTKPIVITPEPVEDWFNPLRGLQFQALMRRLPPQPVAVALKRGFDDTVDNILSIYATLRSLAQGRVSPKAMAGPLTIPQIAYASAASGWTYLIHFLGILSINLAVLNFLPIPPLDGGQMAFLIAEKVRGRPLPESALVVGSWMGLLLVVALMVFVLYQDVARLLFG
jgi:regulator of sigma E protease